MTTTRVGYSFVTGSVVLSLFLCGTSWASQGSGGQAQSSTQETANPTPVAKSDSTAKHKGEKEKHWSGSLVDVNCVEKAKSSGGTEDNSVRPSATAPQRQWLGEGSGQASSQMGPSQTPRQTGALPPGQNPTQNPDISQEQAAQMARAEKIDNESKQCAATATTTVFGLVASGGQMMKFDTEGNTKAGEALKATAIEPGKRVKAKVTGTLAASDTVNVSSVEIKGKHASPASATQGGL